MIESKSSWTDYFWAIIMFIIFGGGMFLMLYSMVTDCSESINILSLGNNAHVECPRNSSMRVEIIDGEKIVHCECEK